MVIFCNSLILLYEIARARYSFHELQRWWSRLQTNRADRLARENDEGKKRCKSDGEDVCSRNRVYMAVHEYIYRVI